MAHCQFQEVQSIGYGGIGPWLPTFAFVTKSFCSEHIWTGPVRDQNEPQECTRAHGTVIYLLLPLNYSLHPSRNHISYGRSVLEFTIACDEISSCRFLFWYPGL